MTTAAGQSQHRDVAVALPALGLCEVCECEIRLRKSGTLYAHGCAGDGTYTGLLEPTFARWLWVQSKRRDAYTNTLTGLGDGEFNGCTRSPRRTARDVDWNSAADLHDLQHERQLRRTGSEVRQPYDGQRCDWLCRDIALAGAVYDRLLAERTDTTEMSR